MRSKRILVALIGLLVACGGGGTTEPVPIDGKKPLELLDPYATIFVENLMTPGARSFAAGNIVLYLLLEPEVLGGAKTPAPQGSTGPGEKLCTSLNGFVGDRLLAVVGVTDTSASGPPRTNAEYTAAVLGTLFPGAALRTTGVFDPLISADTSRGHSRTRPVKWRWTITDAGQSFVEDSTTICVF